VSAARGGGRGSAEWFSYTSVESGYAGQHPALCKEMRRIAQRLDPVPVVPAAVAAAAAAGAAGGGGMAE
jgi:hypothetical protein